MASFETTEVASLRAIFALSFLTGVCVGVEDGRGEISVPRIDDDQSQSALGFLPSSLYPIGVTVGRGTTGIHTDITGGGYRLRRMHRAPSVGKTALRRTDGVGDRGRGNYGAGMAVVRLERRRRA